MFFNYNYRSWIIIFVHIKSKIFTKTILKKMNLKTRLINLKKNSDSYHAIGQSIWKIGRWKICWPWSKCKTWNEKRIRLKNNSLNSFHVLIPTKFVGNLCFYFWEYIGLHSICLKTFVHIFSKLFVDVNFTHTLDWFHKVWIE